MAAPAQVTYTSNVFASPEFVADVVTAIMLVAGHFGVHVLDDQVIQSILAVAVGRGLAWMGHYLEPAASGKLGLTAPMPWTNPTAQDVSPGTSIVVTPQASDASQVTAVVPLDTGAHRVDVTAPTVPVAAPPPLPSTTVVTKI